MKPKLIITGHAQHGKDTVCEILSKVGYTFESSSYFVNKQLIFERLRGKYGYKTRGECYLDRMNHRKEWFDLICEYNKDDLARLGKEIFATNDIYCGLRNIEELREMEKQKVFDFIIWIDASTRLPLEDISSMTITRDMADYIVDNNSNLARLLVNLGTTVLDWEYEYQQRQEYQQAFSNNSL